MNPDLLATRPHPSKRIADAVRGVPGVIDLTLGEPSYGAPDRFLDALAALAARRADDPAPAPRYHRYAPSRGLPELREAVARRYHRRYGLRVDPETQVLITHGAAGAIWLSVFALTSAGDEVLIPSPTYLLYEPIAVSLGRVPVRVPTSPADGFRMDPAALGRYATRRTRLLVLNSPENPTGAVYEPGRVAALVEAARRLGFPVLHDEVFDDHVYEGRHMPAAAADPGFEACVLANSYSKRYGMTGWRLGWLVGSAAVVAEAAKAQTYQSLAVGTALQEAAAGLLDDPACDAQAARRAADLAARGRRFLGRLEALRGFEFPCRPAGGFYLFPSVAGLAARLPDGDGPGSPGERVARHVLDACKVAVVPGTGFGPGAEDFVRISFAAPEAALDEAADRLSRLPAAAQGGPS